MNRRNFIQKGFGGMGMALLASHPLHTLASGKFNYGIKLPIGFQSYVLRNEIALQPTEVMKRMAGFGYQHVEMCSPSGYVGAGFQPLVKYSGRELKKIITDAGLDCISCHFTWNELIKNLDERIDFAGQMGLRHMVCSGGIVAPTLDKIKQNCATMNTIGEKIRKAGMVAGYHNHNGEFENKIEGRPQYDIILEELQPDLVKMQFQVAAIQVGYKAADYFRKYQGRFISAHLQDYDKGDMKTQVILGRGVVDWRDFFQSASTGGLEVVYVEMESDPATMQGSAAYLQQL
jgi:sugar phosphate isomerase/epimerase